MESQVNISNTEWSDVKSKVTSLTAVSDRHEKRINKHGARLDEHELVLNGLRYNITEAVRDGMDDNNNKISEVNEKIHQMELDKVTTELEVLEKEKTKAEEEKQWKNRLLIQVTFASAVTAIVSGVVGFYVAAFLNNL